MINWANLKIKMTSHRVLSTAISIFSPCFDCFGLDCYDPAYHVTVLISVICARLFSSCSVFNTPNALAFGGQPDGDELCIKKK